MVGWIAVCAVLLSTLSPVVSHSHPAEGAFGWGDVCTTTGVERVAMGGAPAGRAARQGCRGALLLLLFQTLRRTAPAPAGPGCSLRWWNQKPRR